MACIGGLKLAPPCSAFIGERRRRFDRSACLIDWGSHRQRLCAVSCGGSYGVGSVEKAVILQAETKESGDERRKGLSIGELDQWMKESVAEIVKNISEAPFLVQISSQAPNNSPSSPTSSVHIIIEKATSESWPFIKRRWNNSNLAPDAVVLVEELESKNGGTTKAWGLVVQGRGMNWPACYVLKTCQVKSCFGFSTHFCLAKSDFSLNYGLDFYFNKLWLQV